MRVSEAMSREVRIASPDQSIAEAAQIMAEIDACKAAGDTLGSGENRFVAYFG